MSNYEALLSDTSKSGLQILMDEKKKYKALLSGYPIYIATKEFQRRKHRKKRINKKWRKRYGVIEFNLMPHGEVFFNEVVQMFYMTKKTYNELSKAIISRYWRY